MKTELKKIYFCDHCKKHNLSAGSIARHEKFCRLNPNNKHKCFAYCTHLKRTVSYPSKTVFTCAKTGIEMYSYLLEKKLQGPYIAQNELTRMPLECDIFEEMTSNEIEERYDL